MVDRLTPLLLSLVFATTASFFIRGQAARSSAHSNAPGDFVVSDAMSLIYGNFNTDLQTSTYTVPMGEWKGSFFKEGDKVVVRPFFSGAANLGKTERVILLTFATPTSADFSCHGCAPLIGAAVLSNGSGGWKVEQFNGGVTWMGGWGRPPDASLHRIGPNQYGVELRSPFMGQGETTTDLSIIVFWNSRIKVALNSQVHDDDLGNCGEGMLPCYQNSVSLRFVLGKDPDYYDIILTRSGTKLTEKQPFKIRSAEGIERRRLLNGEYVVVSGR